MPVGRGQQSLRLRSSDRPGTQRVNALTGAGIKLVRDLLDMPGDEETDLSGGQSMVPHASGVRKVVNNVCCTAPWAISDVSDYFRFQSLKSRLFLASFSTFGGHQTMLWVWGL
tara:strand:- start:2303 stop:2641 length:339 start_codon:yes stop_codon:yes gene_type:complete